jgi:hypothetical protein
MHRILTRKIKRNLLRLVHGRGARGVWLDYQEKQHQISKFPDKAERVKQMAALDAKYFG